MGTPSFDTMIFRETPKPPPRRINNRDYCHNPQFNSFLSVESARSLQISRMHMNISYNSLIPITKKFLIPIVQLNFLQHIPRDGTERTTITAMIVIIKTIMVVVRYYVCFKMLKTFTLVQRCSTCLKQVYGQVYLRYGRQEVLFINIKYPCAFLLYHNINVVVRGTYMVIKYHRDSFNPEITGRPRPRGPIVSPFSQRCVCVRYNNISISNPMRGGGEQK